MNPGLTLLAGALVGLGVMVMVAGWWPAPADLHATMTRLHPAPGTTPPPVPAHAARGPVGWVYRRVLPRLVEGLGLERFAADLALTQQTPTMLAARKVAYAAAGFAAPVVVGAVLVATGMSPPFAVPLAASLLLAGVLFMVPDAEVRRSATAARAGMRRAAGIYLELVALERAADAGATEALDRAAQIGTSHEFDVLRDALLRAELAGQPAWAGLSALAERTGVPELGDVADIMRLSAADGAAVYTTLRARAASLRTQLLTAATARANAASEHMIVPVALLGIAFMALIGYPAFARIFFG